MRNTYNISRLRTRILDALPRRLSPVGESALEAFLSLAGVSTWCPARIGVIELSFVFDIGLPFALIGDNPSARAHAMRAGDAVRDGRYPEPELWRVVHLAALFSHWGVVVEFRAEGASTAPQLEVEVPGAGSLRVAVMPAHGVFQIDADMRDPASRPARGPCLVAVDVRDSHSAHEEIVAAYADRFAIWRGLSGVLSFEPRFWVGIEQKEWIHSARLNPDADVPMSAECLGGADGGRRVLRLVLST